MNLDIGILWIEDSYSSEEESSLRRRIMDAGFLARIEAIPNGEGLSELSRQHSLFHCFDIVLLDYKLKNVDGDELALHVRELFPSTTILFYSGNFSEDALREKIAKKQVEGVYCSHRSRFIDRAGTLIDQTARALDRLSGMRGLAMRVVAECDAIMKDAVLSLNARDPACAAKVADMDKDVIDHLDSSKKAYEAAAQVDLVARLATYAVDSTKLFKHFRRLSRVVANNPHRFELTDEDVDGLRELTERSSQYVRDVLGKRNTLGHAKEVATESGWKLDGNSGITVSDFPGIRQDFAGYIDAFRKISSLLSLSQKSPEGLA
jgi:CheY-like chemotaxis protein